MLLQHKWISLNILLQTPCGCWKKIKNNLHGNHSIQPSMLWLKFQALSSEQISKTIVWRNRVLNYQHNTTIIDEVRYGWNVVVCFLTPVNMQGLGTSQGISKEGWWQLGPTPTRPKTLYKPNVGLCATALDMWYLGANGHDRKESTGNDCSEPKKEANVSRHSHIPRSDDFVAHKLANMARVSGIILLIFVILMSVLSWTRSLSFQKIKKKNHESSASWNF